MTDMELYRHRAEVAVPVVSDTDSWTAVLNEVASLASQIANTPFVPDGLRGSAPAVAAAILSGRELGLGPMTSLANIHVIKGKPALSAALMRALILAQGHQIETVDISDTRAVVRGRRRTEAEWETAEFNADQAKRAGIVLGGYPQDKLYARATSRLARRKFADVIAGMPYSAEELDDGLEPGDVTLPGEMDGQPLSARAAIEQKPRTAQRKQRTQTSPPAPGPTPAGAVPPSAERAGGDLPPLPGEEDAPGPGQAPPAGNGPAPGPGAPDETDYDTAGTVTNRQLTAIWTSLSQTYHFGPDEKDQARMVCAQILSTRDKKVELASSKNLSHKQAKTVLDTLAHWQAQAEKEGEDPRGYLMLMLQTAAEQRGEVPGGE